MDIIEDFNSIQEYNFDTVEDLNNFKDFTCSKLLVMHVNIRSIKKNVGKLNSMIDLMDNKPEVIVCSEAWLLQKVNFIDIPGYVHCYNTEIINQNDGVVI